MQQASFFGRVVNKWNHQSTHMKYGFHSSCRMQMAVRSIEFIGTSEQTNQNGRNIVFRVEPSSEIRVGDVIAQVKDEYNELKDIISPFSGVIVELGDATVPLEIGDVVAKIETKEEEVTSSGESAKKVLNAISNGDNVDKAFIEDVLISATDLTEIRGIAHLLAFPKDKRRHDDHNLKVQALRVFDYLLENFPQREEAAKTHTDIGLTLYQLGDLDAALQHLKEALTLHMQGDNFAHQAASAIQLGALFQKQGNLQSCFEYFEQALEAQVKHFGTRQHAVIAASLNNLGAIQYQRGNFDTAVKYYKDSVSCWEETMGGKNLDTAGAFHNLGIALKHTGDMDAALHNCQKALQIRRDVQANNPDSALPDIAASHCALGQLYGEQQKFAAAAEQYNQAIDIQKRIHGKQSPITASTYNNLGAVLYQQRDFVQALEKYQAALDIIEKSHPPNHLDIASSYNNVGLTLYQQGKLKSAMEHHEKAKDVLEKKFGPEHPHLAGTLGSIGNVYKSQNRFEEALAAYERAHRMLEEGLGTAHLDVASSHNNMAIVLAALGRLDDAKVAYSKAKAIFVRGLGASHPYVASCHFNLALVHKVQDNNAVAMEEVELARAIFEASLGADHPQTKLAGEMKRELEMSISIS